MFPEQKVIHKEKLQIVNQHDTITKKFHHLVPFHGFDTEEVEIKMLQEYSPYGEHLFPEVSVSDKKSLSARTQEYLYFCLKGGLPMAGKHINANTHTHTHTHTHRHTHTHTLSFLN